jgi:hypothetical protein
MGTRSPWCQWARPFTDLPYEIGQFAPITQIANVENVLVISAKSPIKSLEDLIALGRAKGANLTYATPGAASIAHLAAELLARSAGFTMTHVTYRGVTPALTDVLRGEVTMMVCQRLQRRATCPGSKPCPGTPDGPGRHTAGDRGHSPARHCR